VLDIEGLVEKPTPENAPSNLAVSARYVLGPEIFPAIEQTYPRQDGEWQLTDAIVHLIKQGKHVCATVLNAEQRRYDVGNFAGYYKVFSHFALQDEEYGEELRQYLAALVREK